MNTRFLTPLLCCLLATGAFAGTSDLTITVSGIKSSEGRVRLALYRDQKTFGKEKKAVTVQETLARQGAVTLSVRDLPAGRYGILAYHDSNASGSFNQLLGLFPREGYGLSSNPDPAMGISFDASAFEVAGGGDVEMEIRLNYCQGEGDAFSARTLTCWLALSE